MKTAGLDIAATAARRYRERFDWLLVTRRTLMLLSLSALRALPGRALAAPEQANWTRERQGKHAIGLGLYIAQGIIEARGGRITCTDSQATANG